MANLATFGMINAKVKKIKRDNNLETSSIAFEWLCLDTLLHLNSPEIVDAITDGPMDEGIDAVCIQDEKVHIFCFKYTDKFELSKRQYPGSDIDKLLVIMGRIYAKEIKNEDVNAALWEQILEIWNLLDQTVPEFHYYICSNKEMLNEKDRRKLENGMEQYKNAKCHYYDQANLTDKILERKFVKVDGELQFVDKQYFARIDGGLLGIVATIDADALVKLVKSKEDEKKINVNVFNENIRIYMPKSKINKGIKETALSDKNYEFWYLNNGITIVCEECVYTPTLRSPTAKLKNLQIVNGGQTTNSIFYAYQENKDKLESVCVLVRICVTKRDVNISERISETTNTQIPVRSRDLRANDYIQRKLEDEFESEGYYYERKRNFHTDKPKEKRLDNELLGQIYMAYYLDMPSEARDQKALVMGDKYDEIFDDEKITAEVLLLPYQIYLPLYDMKKITQRKKRKKENIDEKEAFISRATFHILNAVKIIINKEGWDASITEDRNKAIKKAIEYISEVVSKHRKERGEVYTHDKFFKEKPTNKIIIDHIESKYNKE